MSFDAALICHRSTRTGPMTVEWTYRDSTGQARQAEAELTPCGPFCVGVQRVVRVDFERRPSWCPRGVVAGQAITSSGLAPMTGTLAGPTANGRHTSSGRRDHRPRVYGDEVNP